MNIDELEEVLQPVRKKKFDVFDKLDRAFEEDLDERRGDRPLFVQTVSPEENKAANIKKIIRRFCRNEIDEWAMKRQLSGWGLKNCLISGGYIIALNSYGYEIQKYKIE